MPTISKGDTILVSGASGFIAVHVCREFLSKGYKVVGTVRSDSKGKYLEKLFKDHKDNFSYVLVDDITKEGAFDEAVKGVDAVAHTASPFYTTGVKDPQELIDPAKKGTRGILESIMKNNPNIKRVVITSSVAAIMSVDSKKAPYHYTEEDWNEDSIPHVEKKGLESTGGHAYQASKTIAEKSLWEFIEKEKPTWEGVTINPPLVLGEVIHQCDDPSKLNTSVALFYSWLTGQHKEDDLPAPLGNWINAHNVAQAHVLALEVEEAKGNRFIIGNGPFCGQDYCDLIHKNFPGQKDVPVGKPGSGPESNKTLNVFDGSKATKVLGIKYESLDDTVKEMGESLKKRFNV